nr:MAG TPA: hypothetical protein [Caudoviricetes sp.]
MAICLAFTFMYEKKNVYLSSETQWVRVFKLQVS